jgi:DNA-directed RNA polymerase specialized sigma24 family protein
MFDPFAFTGQKSAARAEDELLISALLMRDCQGRLIKDIADALGFHAGTLRWRLAAIDHEMEADE